MLSLLVTLALAWPQTSKNSAQALPAPRIEVEIARSRSWQLREHLAAMPRCIPVPRHLLKDASELLGQRLGPDARLAGDGDTVGILGPLEEGRFRLRLFRRGRMVDERFLVPPEGGFLTTPRLVLGERGNLVALVQTQGFAVYVGSALVGVFRDEDTHAADVAFVRGEVHWCPSPRAAKPGKKGFKADDAPPLWLKAEVDGGGREVLLRADPQRSDPTDPQAHEWSLQLAPRRDGKLWLVGAFSAEVLEASSSGSIVRRRQLPYRFPPKGEDPKQVEKAVEQARRKAEEMLASVPAFTDATRKKTGDVRVRIYPWQTRLFARVFALDRDLLIITRGETQPANALLWFPYGAEEARCFLLGEAVDPRFLGLAALVDRDLWFASPFAFLPLEDLAALWDERPENRGSSQ